MAYNQKLAERIRETLSVYPKLEIVEKEMMGGLTFMVNGKMCIGIIKDEMMCRINPMLHEMAIEKHGCRTMDFTKRKMRGYVMVDDSGMKTRTDFDYWINLCLDFNSMSKPAKKKN